MLCSTSQVNGMVSVCKRPQERGRQCKHVRPRACKHVRPRAYKHERPRALLCTLPGGPFKCLPQFLVASNLMQGHDTSRSPCVRNVYVSELFLNFGLRWSRRLIIISEPPCHSRERFSLQFHPQFPEIPPGPRFSCTNNRFICIRKSVCMHACMG